MLIVNPHYVVLLSSGVPIRGNSLVWLVRLVYAPPPLQQLPHVMFIVWSLSAVCLSTPRM